MGFACRPGIIPSLITLFCSQDCGAPQEAPEMSAPVVGACAVVSVAPGLLRSQHGDDADHNLRVQWWHGGTVARLTMVLA